MYENDVLVITNTRTKKYKKYRNSIKSDFSLYKKRVRKNDDLKELEKLILKVDKNLLSNNKEPNIFVDDFKNTWTHGDVTIVPIKNYLENLRNYNFSDLLNKATSVKNEVDFEPHFDSDGNMSDFWLNDDSKYSTLLELKEWIQKMENSKETIINNTKDRIFIFKDAFYKSTNPEIIKNIIPVEKEQWKLKVNKKNKKIFLSLTVSFFVVITAALIFLILFFVY